MPSSFLDPRSYTKILLSFFEELLAPVVNGQVGEAEVAADIVAFPGEVESFFAWKGLVEHPNLAWHLYDFINGSFFYVWCRFLS